MEEFHNLTIIVPTFNEAQSLAQFLPGLLEYCDQRQCQLILVDDGSTDSTKEMFSRITPSQRIQVLHHKLNRGYGAAIKNGLMACHTEYAITVDADGQHSLEDIARLYDLIRSRDADLVIGSRINDKTGSYYRGFGKIIIRNLAKLLMTVTVHDLNSGMKLYRVDLVRNYLNLAPDTMAFSDIITLVFLNNRHLVLEEAIKVHKRKLGKSKIRLETAFHTIMEIINIVILFSPMKIFLPLSLICFLSALTWGVPLMIRGHGVSAGSLLGIITGILFFMLGLIAEQLSLIRRNQNRNGN